MPGAPVGGVWEGSWEWESPGDPPTCCKVLQATASGVDPLPLAFGGHLTFNPVSGPEQRKILE
eukprot:5691179-Alexandrium_andersonii.AAC.1